MSSKFTAEDARINSYKYAKEKLESCNTIENISNKIKEVSILGGDNVRYGECELSSFLLIREYFEKLYFTVEILEKESSSDKTLVIFKISW